MFADLRISRIVSTARPNEPVKQVDAREFHQAWIAPKVSFVWQCRDSEARDDDQGCEHDAALALHPLRSPVARQGH